MATIVATILARCTIRRMSESAIHAGTWRQREGDLEVAFFGCRPGTALANAGQRLLSHAGDTAWLEQTHGDVVRTARPGWSGAGDAIVTADRTLVPIVVTADCVPVLIATRHRVAAVHAGWRGIVAGVVGATVSRLGRSSDDRTGEDLARAVAWIGPAASGCCYEVGDDVARAIAAASVDGVVRATADRPRVDLAAAVAFQLRDAGIADVRSVGICTCCDDAWWSYRREGALAGRNLALIARRGRDQMA